MLQNMEHQARDGCIFFISHEATRTGAPIMLLNVLRWLKINSSIPFIIILNSGGPLEQEFAELGPTISLNRILGRDREHLRLVLHRYWPRVARLVDRWTLWRGLRGRKPSLIYANSAANAEVLEILCPSPAPVLCHVHEMDFTLRWELGTSRFNRVKAVTSHWVAASGAVRDNLVQNHQIPAGLIEVVESFVPQRPLQTDRPVADPSWLRNQLRLPPDALVVGASGVIGWRKGSDLFVQLALTVRRLRPELPVYFVWVGAGTENSLGGMMMHDVDRAGLRGRVILTGIVDRPLDYYNGFDTFVLPSREDPFPLVCLEAALLGKPIVCFASGGGMPGLVAADAGVICPYLDIDAMAGAIVQLLEDPQRRASLGAVARTKVQQRHELSVAAPQLLKVIERVMGENRLPDPPETRS